jgi:hypothetical protein
MANENRKGVSSLAIQEGGAKIRPEERNTLKITDTTFRDGRQFVFI